MRSHRPFAVAAASVVIALTAVLSPARPPAPAASATPAKTSPGARQVVTVGHRGASHYAPENTVAAVDEAARRRVRWVENDVQRTRDGVLVVLHDATLTRTTDVEQRYPGRSPWRVGDLTAAEVGRLDAGGWFGRRYRGERVPTLTAYLAALERNRQSLLLELKDPARYPGIERQTLATLRTAGWLDQAHVRRRLVVQSFDARALRTVHRLRPAVRTGFLGRPRVRELPQYARFCDLVNPEQRKADAAYLAAVHGRRGPHGEPLRSFVWTVDKKNEAVRLARAGADGVISDVPDVVASALHRQ
ncbi:glycerophosphodiester phosphodiesterase [Streptomyces sp. NPDC059740]|uniref:glycerophosphodiester phosphodiesterase n=1 Tax=Streptomyces sp. NPDC059740 TaxID=3346926 RepID=UPI00364B64C2